MNFFKADKLLICWKLISQKFISSKKKLSNQQKSLKIRVPTHPPPIKIRKTLEASPCESEKRSLPVRSVFLCDKKSTKQFFSFIDKAIP